MQGKIMDWRHDHSRSCSAVRRSLLGLTTLVLAGVASGFFRAHAQQPAALSALVFDQVTVVDVEHGKLLPRQRVVIVGNRIQAVGSTGAIKLPKGARVIDARGQYLIPGLWDMHVHPFRNTNVFYPMFVANGVTGIRDASSPISLDTLRLWRQEILARTRVGPPRQVLSGPMIQTSCEGIEPTWCAPLPPNSDTAKFAAGARRLIDSLKRAGADMIKVRDVFPATTFFTIADEARRAGIPVGGHAWDSVDVEVSNRGASIIDHLEPWYPVPSGLRSWCWATKPTASLDQCRSVAERFRHNRTWVVPTMAIYDGRSPGTSRAHALAKQLRERTADFLFGGSLLQGTWLRDSATSPARQQAKKGLFTSNSSEILPDSLGVLRLLQRTDFPIVAGTDAFPQFLTFLPPGFSLHTELAIYVAEGLTPLKALQSATLEPARLLRATDSLGTVAAGKLADLVLLDANPLADITNTTTIRAVVADGRYFDRTALDQLLTDAKRVAKEAGLTSH